MTYFIGLNGEDHAGYHELRRRADAWPTTKATPEGPAGLLNTSRDCYIQGYYAYSLFVVGGAWSIIAVEAALRARLQADEKITFAKLISKAERMGLLARPGWDSGRLDAGRMLRNSLAHSSQQTTWTPAMADSIIAACHEAVAMLFPDEP